MTLRGSGLNTEAASKKKKKKGKKQNFKPTPFTPSSITSPQDQKNHMTPEVLSEISLDSPRSWKAWNSLMSVSLCHLEIITPIFSPQIYVLCILDFMCTSWPNCFLYTVPTDFLPVTREDIDDFVMDSDSHAQVQATLLYIFSDIWWLNRVDPHRIPGTIPTMPNLSVQDHFFCSLFVWKHGLPMGYEALHPDLTDASDSSEIDSAEGDVTDAHWEDVSPDS
jgi:hypothetical protein